MGELEAAKDQGSSRLQTSYGDGAILWFTRFGGRLHTQMLNWFQKINICYFGIKAFDTRSTPWFVAKVIKHISDGSRINQTTITWFCETLHCTNYPRPLRLRLVGSQALRFSGRLQGNRSFDLKTWILALKFTNFNFILAYQLPAFAAAKLFSLWCWR